MSLPEHDPSLPEVLTVDEAATVLRCDRKTLYSAIQRRQVPGVIRIGRSVRIGRDALLDWIGASTRATTE